MTGTSFRRHIHNSYDGQTFDDSPELHSRIVSLSSNRRAQVEGTVYRYFVYEQY